MRKGTIGKTFSNAAKVLLAFAVCNGCASVGTPDGGPYDETPPRFVGSSPKMGSVNADSKTLTLDFDEFIKLENASEKVIISPPQDKQPEISVTGKRVRIKLFDTLRTNTTYTVDFSDGIVDNNEGNPLGDFCFKFSTGEQLDTMEVSGYVLDAKNLEAIKGIQVGLHSNLADSAFTTQPFLRVSRTDSKGHFVIRGIAPGSYRIYALQDMDQDNKLSQKSEMLAWSDTIIKPYSELRYRNDSILNPKTRKNDSVVTVPYTHYYPDNIVLMAFTETPVIQYLSSYDRSNHEKFKLIFSLPQDTLPTITGLNFDQTDAFIIEASAGRDTITYWMSDTLIYYNDTLSIQLDYLATDTAMQLSPRRDTLNLITKKTREKILADQAKKKEEQQKEFDKELKRLEKAGDSLGIVRLLQPQTEFLPLGSNAASQMDLNNIISFDFKEPLALFPIGAVHVRQMVDTLYQDIPFELEHDSLNILKYNLYAEWRPGETYQIEIDSASIYGIYGLHNNSFKQEIKFRALDQYSTFTVHVTGKGNFVAELLNSSDKVVRREKVTKGSADFFFVKPGKYFIRVFDDANDNGQWDTGLYAEKRHAEDVFYLDKEFELKANWEHETEPWDVRKTSRELQKPEQLRQNKDSKKEKKSKNAERDKSMEERTKKQMEGKEKRKQKFSRLFKAE